MSSKPDRLIRKFSQSLFTIDSLDDNIQILSSSAPVSNPIGPPIRYSFQKQPFIIGVAGGTASGKSTVCTKIIDRLGPIDPTSKYLTHEKRVVRISQDSFYRKLTDKDRKMVQQRIFNFDHPSAFDVERMLKTIHDISNGKMVRVPIYDYTINEISDDEEVIYPADVVLFEGLLVFYFPEIRNYFHMKIFVDTDPDTRLSRRVLRDVQELKRDLDVVLSQYINFVKPSFEEFCLPTKKYADIVVPRGPENEVAVDLITTQIRSVYDPSIRHQSIKYPNINLNTNYDYNMILQNIYSSNFSCKHHHKKRKENDRKIFNGDADIEENIVDNNLNDVSVDVNVDNNFEIANGVNNDETEDNKKRMIDIDIVPRSKPIPIANQNGQYKNGYVQEKSDDDVLNLEENIQTKLLIDNFIDNQIQLDICLSPTMPTKLTNGTTNGFNNSPVKNTGQLAFENKMMKNPVTPNNTDQTAKMTTDAVETKVNVSGQPNSQIYLVSTI